MLSHLPGGPRGGDFQERVWAGKGPAPDSSLSRRPSFLPEAEGPRFLPHSVQAEGGEESLDCLGSRGRSASREQGTFVRAPILASSLPPWGTPRPGQNLPHHGGSGQGCVGAGVGQREGRGSWPHSVRLELRDVAFLAVPHPDHS